jgi:hypothetical protein
VPGGLAGQSLLQAPSPDRTVYSESFPGLLFVQLNKRFDGMKRAAFRGSSKVITWTKGGTEFYDLAGDPAERRNLYDPGKESAAALEAQLASWTKTAPAPSRVAPRVENSNLQRLRSLGYAQ